MYFDVNNAVSEFSSTCTASISAISFIRAQSLVIVYFISLQQCFHGLEHLIWIMNNVQCATRIRVGHWIQVYDVKTCLTHGFHRVSTEQLNTLNEKNILQWMLKLNYANQYYLYRVVYAVECRPSLRFQRFFLVRELGRHVASDLAIHTILNKW